MKIVIRGPALVDTSAVQHEHLVSLKEGLVSDDRCTNYFDNDLAGLRLQDGTIRLIYDAESQQWQTQTEYLGSQPIPESLLENLVDATTGQWSDGFGSDCFTEMAERTGAGIDLFPMHAVDQIEVIVDPTFDVPASKAGAISAAVRRGELEQVRMLLDQGADIEEESQGSSPLYGAVISGHRGVALELIRRGADVAAVNTYDCDPLMATASSNKLSDEDAAAIAEELLERGVPANGERDGYTPLSMALHREKTKLANVLKKHGAVE